MNTPSSDPAHAFASLNRRQFLGRSAVVGAGLSVLKPRYAGAADPGSMVRVALLGCGGRGKWIAGLFEQHGGFQFVANCDYFADRANEAGEKLKVPAGRRYHGLLGYQKVLELPDVDAVVIESPPYFHPIHAAAAVAAGKHVYLAKPIAVDVPGCLTVEDSGRRATAAKRVFLVDFQTRAHPAYQDAVNRVHQGGIGRLINGEASYFCDATWGGMDPVLRKDPKNPEVRLRAWGVDRVLSGDVITEQNIHALDVATWIADAAPVKAYGAGGKVRDFAGDCWDHWSVVYFFPNDLLVSFTSKQVGKFWDDICCRFYGTEGVIDTHYFGEVNVLSDDPIKSGKLKNLYTDGVVNNIATFHRSIAAADFSNPTVAPSVRSNLTTILGRTAAYQKTEMTMADLLKRREKWEFSTHGLKA